MPVSVRLPLQVEEDLAEYCVRHQSTRSEVIQTALTEYLSRADAPRGRHPLLDHPFTGGGVAEPSSGVTADKAAVRAAAHARLTRSRGRTGAR